MPFGVPKIWRKQADHSADCYFCQTNIKEFPTKNKTKIKYKNCRSAMKPVQHSSTVPIPSPPPTVVVGNKDTSSSQSQSSSEASVCKMFIEENEPNFPILINQLMLNDLVRDLVSSKEKAELLSLQLKQWDLLKTGSKITFYCPRQDELSLFFITKNTLCFATTYLL